MLPKYWMGFLELSDGPPARRKALTSASSIIRPGSLAGPEVRVEDIGTATTTERKRALVDQRQRAGKRGECASQCSRSDLLKKKRHMRTRTTLRTMTRHTRHGYTHSRVQTSRASRLRWLRPAGQLGLGRWALQPRRAAGRHSGSRVEEPVPATSLHRLGFFSSRKALRL